MSLVEKVPCIRLQVPDLGFFLSYHTLLLHCPLGQELDPDLFLDFLLMKINDRFLAVSQGLLEGINCLNVGSNLAIEFLLGLFYLLCVHESDLLFEGFGHHLLDLFVQGFHYCLVSLLLLLSLHL